MRTLIVFIACMLSCCYAANNASAGDISAMQVFATGFTYWGGQVGWNNFTDPCGLPWGGISCSGASPNRVVVINLQNKGFIGTVNPVIGNLTALNTFEITPSWNISGTIPSTLYTLSSLTTLALGSNSLTGTIPTEIPTAFPNMNFMNFANTYFTGTVPTT